jgi:hypothetical protein
MSYGRPYGWGCHWERPASYCIRYGEKKTAACRECHSILSHEDKEKFFELFDKIEATHVSTQDCSVKGEDVK